MSANVPSSLFCNPNALLEALDSAALVFDAQDRLVAANAAAADLVGKEPAQLTGLEQDAWEALLGQWAAPLREPLPERYLQAPAGADSAPPALYRLETRTFPRRILEMQYRPLAAAGEGSDGCLILLRDVTALVRWEREAQRDQERYTRDIERLEGQLEQVEKYKLELTANVTHDLRTPLASIKASVSGILAGDVTYDPQTLRETLSLIEQETDRLQRRVQNLLSMSKMEAGDSLLNRDWVDLTDVVASALESLKSIQGTRQVRLEFEEELPFVQGDYDQLLIAVRNLLENAFLYSPPETPLEVNISTSLGQLRVRVRDFGSGLMPDEFERIFDKFYRGRSARRIPGTGLGLPICRGIAEAHGGRLWAEHAPGGGVAFVLSVPISGEQPVLTVEDLNQAPPSSTAD